MELPEAKGNSRRWQLSEPASGKQKLVVTTGIQAAPQSGKDDSAAEPQADNPLGQAISSQPAQLHHRSPKQLLEIIANPHASEAEWLRACSALSDYRECALKRGSRSRSQALIKCSALLCLTVALAAAVFTRSQPACPPAAVPAAAVAGYDLDFGPYMAHLQRNIKHNWFPPRGEESKHITVQFKVYRDGSVSDASIVCSSGLASADAAALKAITGAGKFAPLPAGSPPEIDIQFTFDYNVFRQGKKVLGQQPTQDRQSKDEFSLTASGY